MSLRQSQFEVDRLAEEAEKLGVEINRALYRELEFGLNNGKTVATVRGEVINGENILGGWFRVAGTVSGKYTEGRNLLIRLLGKEVFFANHEGYLNWPRMGKISQHGVFLMNDIPVVPTKIIYTRSQISDLRSQIEQEWGFPVIAKHERGYQGKSVKKFDTAKDMEKWANKIQEKNLGMFLWQKFLPTKWDIRVIVIDGKAIGGMKRSAVGSEFRSNFSLGGGVEAWNLSKEEKMLAEKVAKVCGLDYCGVDIMKDSEGNNYILEVNRQCQFKGFEQSTGINVAKLVVEMYLRKQ